MFKEQFPIRLILSMLLANISYSFYFQLIGKHQNVNDTNPYGSTLLLETVGKSMRLDKKFMVSF